MAAVTIITKRHVMLFCVLLLSACHEVKDEGAVYTEEGMDPGVRQIMMEEESQYPQEEEGLIPSPSDQLHEYGI